MLASLRMLVAHRTSSNLSYSGDVASLTHTKEGRLGVAVTGPGEIHGQARLNGDTSIYHCFCTLYAYVSGKNVLSWSVRGSDT